MRNAQLGELVEGGVVGLDGLVGGFEVDSGHGDWGWRAWWKSY